MLNESSAVILDSHSNGSHEALIAVTSCVLCAIPYVCEQLFKGLDTHGADLVFIDHAPAGEF